MTICKLEEMIGDYSTHLMRNLYVFTFEKCGSKVALISDNKLSDKIWLYLALLFLKYLICCTKK